MERLTGVIRPYAWGSRAALARLQGRPVPSAGPEAELWLGAHPGDPASVAAGPLDVVVAADPIGVLGAGAAAEFGPRLPFLLKVLAAEVPLSLQAHPDAERAREQYAAGNANYVDPFHKPELLVALDGFETLCGFRPPAATAELLAPVPALAPVVALLRGGDLRGAVTALLTAPTGLVDEVAAAADALDSGTRALVLDLASRYPRDLGVLIALLLNHVTLAPGEAIFMPAGNLHAYLRGVGVEIMAASDNISRGGLTPKRVDVPELLEVLKFEPLADPVVQSVPLAPGVVGYPAPVREFSLVRITVGPERPAVEYVVPSARIVLCTRGRVRVDGLDLRSGESGFARFGADPVLVEGDGDLYLAAVAT